MKQAVEALFIKPTNTVREAMETITRAPRKKLPAGIALVVDEHRRFIGTVTDGDIRKNLVKGGSIEDTVEHIMCKTPITVNEDLNVDQMIDTVFRKVKELKGVRNGKVDQVIVVNGENRVVAVYDFYELWYKREAMRKDVCVMGTGHVGLTLGVVLAELGFQVTGYDINKDLVKDVNAGKVRFYEKGLVPLLNFHLGEKNIRFVSDLKDINADVYIICVGTPVDEATKKPNNDAIKQVAESLATVLKKDDVVILRSTVTVGTTRNVIKPILEDGSQLKAGLDFYLVFAPERVVEGNAIEEIRGIPQIIGGINKHSVEEASRILQKICPSIVTVNSLESAEMVKLINNTYRDYSFAFANGMVRLCDRLELDTVKLIKAANEGYPRNPIPLPSPGVGGYCLSKDPYLLAEVANSNQMNSDMFILSRMTNEAMPQFVADKVGKFIDERCDKEKKIKVYLMGLAFKGYPETSDMRGSSAIDFMNILSRRYAGRLRWCGFDPVVPEHDVRKSGIDYMPYKEGFKGAHCTLIMNNHQDFAKMDIFSLLELKKKPGLFFDAWQFFSGDEVERIKGIEYQSLGGRY